MRSSRPVGDRSPARAPSAHLIARGLARTSRAERWALLALLVLPLLIFAVPALFGHPVLLGDDFDQNFPLRVLVGSQIRHGHLPIFDPYIWSGAPLLAGWNAGAFYPLSFLFVFLPGVGAWTLNLVITYWIAGIGSFAFLRASRLGAVASFLGALSFAFAGAMTAQVVHFGLVAGMSWVPVALLALLRLSRCVAREQDQSDRPGKSLRARLWWTTVLGVASAMAILSGEPRAIVDFTVIVAIYALWRAIRLGRRAGPYALWAACGVLLAIGLGAVQWLPGTDAVSTSQRAASNYYLFTSGSLYDRWLPLLLVPDLLGGSGSFGQPPFFGNYNLTEVTGYVGMMPLVASFALLGRIRFRRPAPEWIVWQVMALVGVLLALGGNTPLWHVLIHIPLFGGQRLQSRNILIADMGFAFLLAYWADSWLSTSEEPRALRSRILGTIPALLTVAVVVVAFAWGAGMLRWLGVEASIATYDGGLRVWFLPFGVLALGALALVVWGYRTRTSLRAAALTTFVVVDVVVFTLMVVVTAAPGYGSGTAPPIVTTTTAASLHPRSGPGHAGSQDKSPSSSLSSFSLPPPSPGATFATPPTLLPASAYAGSGRFAVYDPDLLDDRGLNTIGAPDLNVPASEPSIQGYGSIVDGTYASATGTHVATGLGQNILDPEAVGDGTLDQLDTTALFAPRDYFLVTTVHEVATPDPSAGRRDLTPSTTATWYFGENLLVTSIVVPDRSAAADVERGIRFGLVSSGGSTTWAPPPTSDGGNSLLVRFPAPEAGVALVARGGHVHTTLDAPSITSEDGTVFVADGQLESAVVPPRWTFRGIDGSFAVFGDRFAQSPLMLRPLGRGSVGVAAASVRATQGPVFAPSSAEVSSTHGVEVIRSEAAIPGWSATWKPLRGPVLALSVRRVGLVQAVEVPGGRGVLRWNYDPPGWTAGWVISVVSLAILLGSLVLARSSLRRWRHAKVARPGVGEAGPRAGSRERQGV